MLGFKNKKLEKDYWSKNVPLKLKIVKITMFLYIVVFTAKFIQDVVNDRVTNLGYLIILVTVACMAWISLFFFPSQVDMIIFLLGTLVNLDYIM